ncbi:MAG: UTP--glucose-1-phosphate uridylyltransferase [Candidatus Peribacteraceae bacterium]|nr:UTP--glucose-1-phosphate uridylyltransferase [Candidatus Peribacteraceae bacterium]
MQLTQAILPVAGLGTRFLPWTKVVPKELLPIGNQPIIALLVDECLSVGIRDICFVINRGKEMIPQYFYDMPALERELEKRGKLHMLEELSRYHNVNFHVVYQDQMLGDGHALLQAKSWVATENVAILFGDDLIVGKENGLQQLVKGLGNLKDPRETAMLCLQEVEKALLSKYGVVGVDASWKAPHERLRKVTTLVEKPKPENAPSNLGIVGKYIIPQSVFGLLHRIEEGSHPSAPLRTSSEIRLIDALMTGAGVIDIYGYVFEGQRLDTGTPEGYKEAVKVLG